MSYILAEIDLFFWNICFGFRYRILTAWRQWHYLMMDWESDRLTQLQSEMFWQDLNAAWRDSN